MQGFFKAVVHDASHLGKTPEEKDRPFLEAMKAGKIMEFLDSLPVVQQADTPNQIFHTMPAYLGWAIFGMPDAWSGWNGGTNAGLAAMELCTVATEPTYTEWSNVYSVYRTDFDGESVNATYTLWKRFIEDQSEPHRIWIDAGDREGYYFRDRFLWLPSNGLMPNIRSARPLYDQDADATANGYNRLSRFARTRFKDSGGNPITLEKTADQSFLVEYILKLFSR
jgi:hypothetical protein